MRRFINSTLLIAIGCGLSLATTFAIGQDRAIDFDIDIKPILSDRCYFCHGPDAADRRADLRLDTEDGAASVIEAGDPEGSELFDRIHTDDDDLKMPPSESKISLTPEEIEKIKKWIEQGATWKEHWAFVRPQEPNVPQPDALADWCQNEIDHFVLERLRETGLEPAARASRETLARRLSFDLTGLPPSIKQLDQFLNDDSKDAYEQYVDRLLDSTSYGERMASEWLDSSRYSDTYGYQVDRDRFVWPWRDWVIRSLNENKPYDEFITEQLAGDLLPGATDDQVLATTFNRLHPQKVEGGSVEEEFRVEYVADRFTQCRRHCWGWPWNAVDVMTTNLIRFPRKNITNCFLSSTTSMKRDFIRTSLPKRSQPRHSC